MENAEKPMQDLPNSSVRQKSPCPPQQQQPKLQSSPGSSSSQETETLSSEVQAVSVQQSPSSEQPAAVHDTQSTPSIQPNPLPVAIIGSDQIGQQRKGKVNEVPYVFLCWCGKVFTQFSEFVPHLQQHKETTWCVLCHQHLATFQHLNRHLDLHLKVGMAHLCGFCRLPFLDHSSRLRHIDQEHSADLWQLYLDSEAE